MASPKQPECLDQEYSSGGLEERKGVQCAPPGEEGDGNADVEETKESKHSGPGNGPREDVPVDLLCQEGEVFYKTFTFINANSVARKQKLLVSLHTLGGEPSPGEPLFQQHPSQTDSGATGPCGTKDTAVTLGSKSGEVSGDGHSSHVTRQAPALASAEAVGPGGLQADVHLGGASLQAPAVQAVLQEAQQPAEPPGDAQQGQALHPRALRLSLLAPGHAAAGAPPPAHGRAAPRVPLLCQKPTPGPRTTTSTSAPTRARGPTAAPTAGKPSPSASTSATCTATRPFPAPTADAPSTSPFPCSTIRGDT